MKFSEIRRKSIVLGGIYTCIFSFFTFLFMNTESFTETTLLTSEQAKYIHICIHWNKLFLLFLLTDIKVELHFTIHLQNNLSPVFDIYFIVCICDFTI